MSDMFPFIIIVSISLSAFAAMIWGILRLAHWQHERILSYWKSTYPFEKKSGTRWGYVADMGKYTLSLETFAGLKVPYRVGSSAISLGRTQGYACVLRMKDKEKMMKEALVIPAKSWMRKPVVYPAFLPDAMREVVEGFDAEHGARPAIMIDEQGYSFVLGQVLSLSIAKKKMIYMRLLENLARC